MSDPISTKTQSDIEQLFARSLCYQMLAMLFRHPAGTVNRILAEENSFAWDEAADVLDSFNDPRIRDSFQLLIKEFKQTSHKEWIRLHEACFGHTAHGPVPDYELEYGEEHTHRQPHQLGDIAAFYRAFGIQINAKAHERVDHISVECEFMQYLLLKEAYALENNGKKNVLICQEASKRFLSEHLGCWGPAFSRRLAKYSDQGLMKRIADFAFSFLTRDCEMLGIPPGPDNLPVRMVREKEDTGCVNCEV